MNGLTSITDTQAESLRNVVNSIELSGLTSLSNAQLESLIIIFILHHDGLTSITDEQANRPNTVRILKISEDLQPLIDKYRKECRHRVGQHNAHTIGHTVSTPRVLRHQ